MSQNDNFFASVDVVNFVIRKGELCVSLWRRTHEPYCDQLALPGVIINGQMPDANLESAVSRVIRERLGQEPRFMTQVGTVGNATRDHRGFSISTLYMSIHADESHGDRIEVVPYSDISSGEVPLPFDHKQLIEMARDRLRSTSTYSSLPIMFIPEDEVSVTSLTDAYKVAVDGEVRAITVRSRIKALEKNGLLKELGSKQVGNGRPTMIYRHASELFYFDRSITALK